MWLAGLGFVALTFTPTVDAAGPQPSVAPATPIQHLVVLMQENHTFDNYFGTYPGVDGPPDGLCMPRDPATPSAGCVEPYHLESRRTVDLAHGTDVAAVALNGGKLDGFIAAQNKRNLPGDTAMGYYDGSDLPFYWNLASSYVLADRFFSSDAGGSKENHVFWVSGQSGGGSVPRDGYTFDTIFDRLQAAGIDWKFYVQNYDPSITFRNLTGAPQDSQTVWVPLLNFDRFIKDPDLSSRIVDVSEYHKDLAAGTLPAVSFIAPSGASEHPPGDVAIGQVYGASQVTALMQSSSWSSSLFVITWDDWGGWYDHVPPPQVDANGYGMRVPALFVSPYAARGRIDSTTFDFTSILRFVEDNWHIPPLTARDAAANSVGTALDFGSSPQAPILPGPIYPERQPVNPSARLALLAIYGLAGIGVPAVVALWWRRREWAPERPGEVVVRPRYVPVDGERALRPGMATEGVADMLAARLRSGVATQAASPLITKPKIVTSRAPRRAGGATPPVRVVPGSAPSTAGRVSRKAAKPVVPATPKATTAAKAARRGPGRVAPEAGAPATPSRKVAGSASSAAAKPTRAVASAGKAGRTAATQPPKAAAAPPVPSPTAPVKRSRKPAVPAVSAAAEPARTMQTPVAPGKRSGKPAVPAPPAAAEPPRTAAAPAKPERPAATAAKPVRRTSRPVTAAPDAPARPGTSASGVSRRAAAVAAGDVSLPTPPQAAAPKPAGVTSRSKATEKAAPSPTATPIGPTMAKVTTTQAGAPTRGRRTIVPQPVAQEQAAVSKAASTSKAPAATSGSAPKVRSTRTPAAASRPASKAPSKETPVASSRPAPKAPPKPRVQADDKTTRGKPGSSDSKASATEMGKARPDSTMRKPAKRRLEDNG